MGDMGLDWYIFVYFYYDMIDIGLGYYLYFGFNIGYLYEIKIDFVDGYFQNIMGLGIGLGY